MVFFIIYPNGDIRHCYQIDKSLGSIYKGIKFNDKLTRCPFKFCNCPVNMYDLPLLRKAISEVGSYDAEWIQPFKYRIREFVKNLFFEGKQNYLIENTKKLIIEKVMKNKFSRKYLFK